MTVARQYAQFMLEKTHFFLRDLCKMLLTSLGSIQPHCSYCIKQGTLGHTTEKTRVM